MSNLLRFPLRTRPATLAAILDEATAAGFLTIDGIAWRLELRDVDGRRARGTLSIPIDAIPPLAFEITFADRRDVRASAAELVYAARRRVTLFLMAADAIRKRRLQISAVARQSEASADDDRS
jgi:hypothetical protein